MIPKPRYLPASRDCRKRQHNPRRPLRDTDRPLASARLLFSLLEKQSKGLCRANLAPHSCKIDTSSVTSPKIDKEGRSKDDS